MKFLTDKEEPHFGTCAFAPTCEDGFDLRIKNSDRVIGYYDSTVSIVESTYTDKGVLEGW